MQKKDFLCSACAVKKATEWRNEHQEQHKAYLRKFVLHSEGKLKTLKEPKRDYPLGQKCELCGQICERLSYHHFDDSKPHIGIWVCSQKCHGLCETIDQFGLSIAQRYLELKTQIQNES
jgi:hypothetical protein